jgi:hypothetical protein
VIIHGGDTTGNGGGLSIETAGWIVVGHSQMWANTASGDGGGLYLESTGSSVWLHGNTIEDNNGANGGGGVVKAQSAYLYTNKVAGNTGLTADGGLQASVSAGGELIVSNNTIFNNNASAGGSGLTVAATGTGVSFLDVHNNIVYGNGTAANMAVAPDCDYLRYYMDWFSTNNSIASYEMCADYLLDSSNAGVDFSGRIWGDIRLAVTDALLIDHGTDYNVPTEDFEGDSIPLDGDGTAGSVPDIGADEYNPANVAGPAAITIAPTSPSIGLVNGSVTLTVSLDLAAKRDVVVYLANADTNTGSPGQPLVTVTPQYLKILKGATSAQATVQALSAARHGTALITASDPSNTMTNGTKTVTVDINPPTALTLGLPSGTIGTATPTYTWTAREGVDSYQIWVGNATTNPVYQWYTAAAANCGSGTGTCSVTPAVSLAPGSYSFTVKGGNASGNGPWAPANSFTYTP